MNTKPDNIPARPEGAVYLGKGRSFATPKTTSFQGWMHDPEIGDFDWRNSASLIFGWSGNDESLHYAAPADSEVARLNGFEAVPPCPSENPCAMPDFEASELELLKHQAAALGAELELERVVKENILLRQSVSDERLKVLSRDEQLKAALLQADEDAENIATLRHALDINLKQAKQALDTREAFKAQLSEAVRLGDLLIPYTTEAEERENIAAWEAFKASSVKGGAA